MMEQYDYIKVGEDCLNAEMKRIRIQNKDTLLKRGYPVTDDDLLAEALGRDKPYRGPVDPGPQTD